MAVFFIKKEPKNHHFFTSFLTMKYLSTHPLQPLCLNFIGGTPLTREKLNICGVDPSHRFPKAFNNAIFKDRGC